MVSSGWRGKAFVLIDSEIDISNERKTKIIESIKYNRLDVCEHNDSKTFHKFLETQFSSEKFMTNEASYDMISVIVIARKYPGPYEFRKYSKTDLFGIIVKSKVSKGKKMWFAIIMEDRFEMYCTDATMEGSALKMSNKFYKFEAKCPIRDEVNHFERVLDQFIHHLSNTSNLINIIQSWNQIKNENTECEIKVFNPMKEPLYLGP
ncbi:uncharacterized protein LOC143914832 [Arctopsyche grandis]|uniref:uncharacterized protein LOC143914832 n=1 Tax=Arctopsyche grandis TaxID=121162 RepID=UPI00406DA4A7